MIKVKFWGVRGSIPCPGPKTMKYGGNTACIELRFPEVNRHIIIDAGSGIRDRSCQGPQFAFDGCSAPTALCSWPPRCTRILPR